MSSMVKRVIFAALLGSTATLAFPAHAQQPGDWDRARASLVASAPSQMAQEIERWEELIANPRRNFADYASFLLANPGFPNEDRLRGYAEGRLREQFVPPEQLLSFFATYEPVTNFAKAHYALALAGHDPEAARVRGIEAWRGGEMGTTAEAALSSMYGDRFTQADQDARMDALLWQRDRQAAERQLPRVSSDRRDIFEARLAILQGGDGATSNLAALRDPGYLYNRSRELRQEGRTSEAVGLIANRGQLSHLPFDQTAWVEELLAVAKLANARDAQRIATSIDDAFEPGTDISQEPYKLRDDYTSLMWLGGTKALWERSDALGAVPLFYRYGAAARTPPTRSKGFYWAGFASGLAGNDAETVRYYEMAGQYPDRFYGQLALRALGRDLPNFAQMPNAQPTPEERTEFMSAPLTLAVSEVAREAPWATGIRFYRAIADQAETLGEHLLVAELARDLGRRDLAVNLADAAMADGHEGFIRIGNPRIETPPGTDWTLVHAITRQESQFAQNAISHAGAQGLMQLMPGTAREEAGRAGIQYMSASVIDDPDYNIRLGSNHIRRLISYYDGSYPLAIAAYNAGPGNVNRWLRQNGDPRRGEISWIEWIEKIRFFETKNYVQRVLENAVVYEKLYPEQAGQSRDLIDFLR